MDVQSRDLSRAAEATHFVHRDVQLNVQLLDREQLDVLVPSLMPWDDQEVRILLLRLPSCPARNLIFAVLTKGAYVQQNSHRSTRPYWKFRNLALITMLPSLSSLSGPTCLYRCAFMRIVQVTHFDNSMSTHLTIYNPVDNDRRSPRC